MQTYSISPWPVDQRDCAFLGALEEPLHRIVRAASLPAGSVTLSHSLVKDVSWVFAYYSPEEGVVLSDGFLRCMRGDPKAAVQALCHEVGHAVQHSGSDADARRALDERDAALASGKPLDAGAAALSRDIERQADAIGGELCARAGFSPDLSSLFSVLMRCDGASGVHTAELHPDDFERFATAQQAAPRLKDEQARLIGAAIRRRAQRLMAGLSSASEDPEPSDLSPREWALTPAADADRFGGSSYSPSADARLAAVMARRKVTTNVPAAPTGSSAINLVSGHSADGDWLKAISDWLYGRSR